MFWDFPGSLMTPWGSDSLGWNGIHPRWMEWVHWAAGVGRVWQGAQGLLLAPGEPLSCCCTVMEAPA